MHMRRLAATTGRLLLAAATLTSATALAGGSALAATTRHASGWGSPTTGHGSTFGQPATAGPVSSNANLQAWTANGDVKASLIRDGVLYLGGNFTQLLPPTGVSAAPVPALHIAALSASTGQPIPGFAATADGEVDAMK